MMHTIGLHHVFAPIALSVYPICIMCFMKTRELLLLLALTATTGMQAQRIKGSDTVLPIAQQTAERFMTLNPSARVTVTGGGTGVGISALLDQTTDIAMASRAIQFSEKMSLTCFIQRYKVSLQLLSIGLRNFMPKDNLS